MIKYIERQLMPVSTSLKNFVANVSVFPSYNSKPVFTVLGGIPALRMAMLFLLGLKI